jgi:glutamine amidotransferase
MSVSVTMLDYGVGNLHSVAKALRESGADVLVTNRPEDVRRAERLVLPGVGAFADGMARLEKNGLSDAVGDFFETQRPLLGICLGMQMLFDESEEFGTHSGLGVIPGRVVGIPLRLGFKVPHIGWSRIHPCPQSSWQGTVLADTHPGTRVYFVHSFSAVPECELDRLADTNYGSFRVSAAVQRGNVIGCQFHPEKSGEVGLTMLRRFLQL